MPPRTPAVASPGLRWDIFCRVVDNFGDAAICWRLARQLANEYSLTVRLWIDQPQALSRLVPGARPGQVQDRVSIECWRDDDPRLSGPEPEQLADVVIAGFACDLPAGYRRAMTSRRPVWINLDYLSAQAWVDTHHGLPSPKSDGLIEYFFFPGFTPESGGLLREADLIERCERFDRDPTAKIDFLRSLGVEAEPGDRFISVFSYPDSPVAELIDRIKAQPHPPEVPKGPEGTNGKNGTNGRWRLLIPEGIAPELTDGRPDGPQVGPLDDHSFSRLPFLTQADYDRLLWCCDLNCVRGEDSFVRALWSGRPLIWQAYRQADNAHQPKLEAFLDRWRDAATVPQTAAHVWRSAHVAWNAAPDPSSRTLIASALQPMLDQLPILAAGAHRWRSAQLEQTDLASRLVGFAAGKL
jgi:uncharacterized repeat protein (TIGR03837 family)